MKKLILTLLILGAIAGGFVWLGMADVSVEQTQVKKTIPNDRFFEN